jgi:energy-coupling factor transporter ATP-binding protein EcfA2
MSNADTLQVEVTDLAGIAGTAHAVITEGVNELRGPNGAGKSSLAAAVAAGLTSTAVDLHEGADHGQVVISGRPTVMRRSGAGVKAETTGPPPDHRLLPCDAVATLITGDGVQDPDRANARRLKALTRIYPLPVDEAALGHLVQDDEEVRAQARFLVGQQLPDAQEALRKLINTAALALEKEAAEDEAAIKVHADQAAELLNELGGRASLTRQTAAQARADVEEAQRELARLEAAREKRVALEDQQQEIRGMDDPEPPLLGRQEAREEAVTQHLAAVRAKEEAQEALRAAEKAVEVCHRELASRTEALEATVAEHARWKERRAILGKEVEGPEQDEVDAAVADVTLRRKVEERASRSDSYRAATAAAEARTKELAVRSERAAHLRRLVEDLGDRIGVLLEGAGIPDTRIVRGRLSAVLAQEGGAAPRVVDLTSGHISSGELVRWALRVGAPALGAGVLNLTTMRPGDPNWWNDLSPERRRELQGVIAETAPGLTVLAEVPGDGPFEVFHYATDRATPVTRSGAA